MTTVSVVIAAYNAARWLPSTLESVLAQDPAPLETIVVDDGSTDDTARVVESFPRVRVISKSNGGPASARNLGIRESRGEYIAFIDADDLWLPGKLRLQLEVLRETGLAWIYSDAHAFDDRTGRRLYTFGGGRGTGVLRTGDVLRTLLLENFIASPTPVVKRDVFLEVGLFCEEADLQKREDWDMWLRIAARFPIGLVDRPLALYRVHPASGTYGEPPMRRFRSLISVIDRAVACEPERLGTLRARAVAHVCAGTSVLLARNGDFRGARRLCRRAIALAPTLPRPYVNLLVFLLGPRAFNGVQCLKRRPGRTVATTSRRDLLAAPDVGPSAAP